MRTAAKGCLSQGVKTGMALRDIRHVSEGMCVNDRLGSKVAVSMG